LKTIKEWLSELPEPYRTQALKNTNQRELGETANSLNNALSLAFVWDRTEQGHSYWEDLIELVNQKKSLLISPTNALSAIHAIALKEGFAAEEIESVSRNLDIEANSKGEWIYRLISDTLWHSVNLSNDQP
jgi:hypothetical protein